MKTLIAKFIIGVLITLPWGLLILYKFGDTANYIYWRSLLLGRITHQLIWNYWE